jgi:hypothetical protein
VKDTTCDRCFDLGASLRIDGKGSEMNHRNTAVLEGKGERWEKMGERRR